MTSFETVWKRTTALFATLIALTLMALGAYVVIAQLWGPDELPVTERQLKYWDDAQTGIRCYTYGENLRCFAVLDEAAAEEEESEDDSFPESEWFKQAGTEI